MPRPSLLRVLTLLLSLSALACTLYDPEAMVYVPRHPDASGPDASEPDGSSAEASVDACVPSGEEMCNGLDDDCDGVVDNITESCLPNAVTQCASGVCLLNGCQPGHCDCNGSPNDGCEVPWEEAPPACLDRCSPPTVDDAGMDAGSLGPDAAVDAGASDAATADAAAADAGASDAATSG